METEKTMISRMPNAPLYKLNADSSSMEPTYDILWAEWQARKNIMDVDELKAFDRLYPDAYKGNFTKRQLDMLREYHALRTDGEREEFLVFNPWIAKNPREEYLRGNPEANAQLALWGQEECLTKAAYDKMTALAESLDIPESAMVGRIPPDMVEPYFEYKDITDKMQAKLYRLENPEFDVWLQQNKGIAEITDKPEALRIDVKYAEQDAQYNALPNAYQQTAYLIENPEYAQARYTRYAWNKGYAEEWVSEYVQYREAVDLRGIPKKEYLWKHRDFYEEMLRLEDITPIQMPHGVSVGGMGGHVSLVR